MEVSEVINRDFNFTNLKLQTFEAEYDNENSGSTKTINWNNGQNQKVTLTGNCTFTFTEFAVTNKTYRVQLKIIQDATGSWNAIFPANVKLPNGEFIRFGAAKTCIITFYFDGTDYIGIQTNSY
jgi:hypothetical protein